MSRTDKPIFYVASGNTPSVKTLMETFSLPVDVARRVKGVLTGKVDLMTIKAAYARQESALNAHEPETLVLEALSELLGACGAEYVASSEDGYRHGTQYGFDYLNFGDSYDTTLIHDAGTDRWSIGSWGDKVERAKDGF